MKLRLRGQEYGGVARNHWRTVNERLDPEVDHHEIYRNVVGYEFPWDTLQALSFALFRTYAVPEIGKLLDATGAFAGDAQRRYDDTILLLEPPARHGFADPRARAAVRRINRMHRSYHIPNDQMRYVLSTFVVVPKRWLDEYGKRPLTPIELRASVNYYRELGRHMGIREIPETYEEFATLMDSYEADHFAYDDASRRVADATMRLLTTFYPRPLASLIDMFSRALMDLPLLRAFGYEPPPAGFVALARAGLRARGQVLRAFPARSSPVEVEHQRRIRGYPNGYVIERLGTFPRFDKLSERA